MNDKCYEVAAYVLLTLLLGAAIFFWGRGIRLGSKSDLLTGPGILLGVCAVTIYFTNTFGVAAELVVYFGFATILLSLMAKPGGILKRRDVVTIGLGVIVAGICLGLLV